jgi:K+-transporting ATPase ATPase C chain
MYVHLRRSVLLMLLSFAVLGLAYAYAGTGLAQAFFPYQANGSIGPNGSALIGQPFDGTRWFHGRPDDFGPYAANPAKGVSGGDNPLKADGIEGQSGATNLGPRSAVLVHDTRELIRWWRAHGVDPTSDLVTTSGSGLDPDISPRSALVQIPMIAKATGVPASTLRSLVRREEHPAEWGFLGSPTVNVLQLNEALAHLEARLGLESHTTR